ncbi:MAG: LytTR family DNA-binding domain-containing protein [Ruminococcus sp.]|nr:LytTR family DNA-binding domain-containing protein [Ruminococcus sp.]
MRIGICDDEVSFHRELKTVIDRYSASKAISVIYFDFMSGEDLIKYLSYHDDIDVIFMDYQMNKMSGLETSQNILEKNIGIPIIFLTSFPEIVYDTFKVNAFRFLVKPVDVKKLSDALDDLLVLYSSENYILVTVGDISKRININDILYIEARNKGSLVRLKNQTLDCGLLLSDFQKKLPEDRFFRSHKSFLVGFKYITEYGTSEIVFCNGEKAKISRYRFNDFKSSYFDYMKRYIFEVDLS